MFNSLNFIYIVLFISQLPTLPIVLISLSPKINTYDFKFWHYIKGAILFENSIKERFTCRRENTFAARELKLIQILR